MERIIFVYFGEPSLLFVTYQFAWDLTANLLSEGKKKKEDV